MTPTRTGSSGTDRVGIAAPQMHPNDLVFGSELNWKKYGGDGECGRCTTAAVAAFATRAGIGVDGSVLTIPLAERIDEQLSPFMAEAG